MSALRRIPRPALLLAGALLTAGLSLRCAGDPAGPGGGGLDLLVDWTGYADRGVEDQLHLEILDSQGHPWIDPLTRTITDGESLGFDLVVPEATGLSVGMWIDSANEVGRGIVAEGMTRNVIVRAARDTQVEIAFGNTVPILHPVGAAPGDLTYEVSWTRVEDAQAYELLESSPNGGETFATEDSSLTLALLAARTRSGGDETELVYRVRALLDRGAGLFSDPVSFAIGEVRNLPYVVSVLPANGAEAVRDTTAPRLVFDREMDWSTLGLASLALVDAETETPVAFDPHGEGEVLTLDPSLELRRGRTFRLDLIGPLADLAGRPFDQEPTTSGLQGFSSSFSVEVYAPLTVTSVSPADGALDVAIGTVVEAVLSREALSSSVNAETVRLEDASGTLLPATATWIPLGLLVRVEPASPLAYDSVYQLRVTPGVRDVRGEPLDQDPSTEIPEYEAFLSSFHTQVQPVGPLVVSTVPAEGEQNHPVGHAISVTFDRPIDPSTVSETSSFRILKLPVGAGIPGRIDHDGERRVFTFVPTGSLEAGVRYRIDLTPAIRDDDGVSLDQFPDVPGFQGFQAEFRVEASFGLSSVDPADGAERVPLDAAVVLTFGTALDPATLEAGAELLRGTLPLSVTRSLSANGRVLTLEPGSPFQSFTTYTVQVDEDLRSLQGSRFDDDLVRPGYQPFLSRFTSRPDSIPPRVDPKSLVPPDGGEGIDPGITVEVGFTKRILPASVNPETVILRRVGGTTVPGTLSVSADSTKAFFDPAEPLLYEREYELEVLTWIVDVFDVRFDQDPVTPDRQPFHSTFRIDHERESPRVIAVSPGDGLEGVSLLAEIDLFFSEPMDPASIPSAFQLLAPTGDPVPGVLETAADSVRVTFSPTAPLREDRVYQVRVAVSATDRWGNPLDQDAETGELEPFVSSFRTEPDEIGPIVLGVQPEDGETGVELEVEIELLFDEPLLEATVSWPGITLQDDGGVPVPLASLEQTEPGRVRLVPASPLATSTEYTLTVTSTVTDTLGNPFDQIPGTPEADPFSGSFRTRAENDPPYALGTVFEDSPPPRETNPKVALSEAIDPSSLEPGDVRLYRLGSEEELPLDATLLAPDTLLVTPLVLLEALTSYELVVEGLRDLFGNVFDQVPGTPELDAFVQPFQTAQDRTPPRVTASSPEEGAEGVRPEDIVSLTFSEPMKTSDFDDFSFQVVRLEGSQEYPADGSISWNVEQTRFDFTPDGVLLPGFVYEIRADYRLRDLAGNPLDQDPETPEADVFVSHFLVGDFPQPELGAPVCSDTTWVEFDASASVDPDGEIVELVFQWGDGGETVIEDPVPADFIQGHAYPCLDFAGCDGLDNDGDGLLDADDCDESYRLILRARDADGLWGADSSGVSFCAFGVLGVLPADGETEVDSLLREIRIDFSGPVAGSSLAPENFVLESEGFVSVAIDSVHAGGSAMEVVIALADTLDSGTLYNLAVGDQVIDESGRPADQDPCTPKPDPFVSSFTTRAGVLPRSVAREIPH